MWFALDHDAYEQEKRDINNQLLLRPAAQQRLRLHAPSLYSKVACAGAVTINICQLPAGRPTR